MEVDTSMMIIAIKRFMMMKILMMKILMKPFMTTLPMMTKILMKMMNITKTMRNTTKTIIIEIITKDLEGGRHLCLLLDPTMCFKNRSYYSILSVAF